MSSNKNVFIIIVCILVAGAAYYFLTDDSLAPGITDGSEVRQDLLNKTQSFIERSAKIQQINIDTAFLTDPTFTSLRSFATPVPNQPLGRADLFGSTQGTRRDSSEESQ
jgi:hypothetical protein